MLSPLTFTDTPNATFSPEWADGQLQLDLLDGQMTAKSGRPHARASRSRSRAKAPELLMRGTCGPTFSASPVPDGPLSLWESRLRQRLARIGSSECNLTWRASAMSDGALLSRLVPSTPRTVEIDSGLLLQAAYWVTCTTRDWKDTPGMALATPDGRSRCDQLPRQVAATAAHWSTPRATDGEKGGPNQSFGAGGQPLPAQAFHVMTSMWPTPMAGTPAQNGNNEAGNNDSSRKTVEIARQARSAMWPTPMAVDGQRGLTTRPQDTGIPLPQRVGQVLGMAPAGSSATTAKRGVLNPAFPCWLMGYPI